MSNVDINVDRRTDGLTDGLTDGRTDGRTDGQKIGRLYRTLLQAGAIMMWKRGEIAPKEQFLLFFHIILYIFPTSGVKLYIHLFNVVVQFIVFLTFSTLICRGTDISKCFSESLGIRDNESRLYIANLQNSSIFHVQYVFTAVWCQALS